MEEEAYYLPLFSLPKSFLLYAVVCTIVLWYAASAFYQLFWSPIAGIPGPKLAAVSFWYEFYYDVIKGGQYQFHIRTLHEKYGPIIRINPAEIHINDPDYYDQVFVSGATRRTEKWSRTADSFGFQNSVFNTISHDLHRKRRAVFANHFSSAAITRLQPLIRDKIQKLCKRLDKAAETNEVVCLTHAYAAVTIDIITEYCFAESWNYLDSEDFNPQFLAAITNLTMQSHMAKQFPWMLTLARILPTWLSLLIAPDQAHIVNMDLDFVRQVQEIKDKKSLSSTNSKSSHSIFNALLDADVPDLERSVERLGVEARMLVVAGFITTGHMLDVITYHLLQNPPKLARLMEELRSVETDLTNCPQSTFERLPYLTAIIQEGLRLGFGLIGRIQRVSPDTTLKYGDYLIPPGTPVSMAALDMHENSDIFVDPKTFMPERWLPLDTVGKHLDKYLVPFSKGSRQCAGMNLAWAELYLTIPALFGGSRRMHLHDVVFERDIETARDGLAPWPSEDSKGLRVTITNPTE